MPSMSPIRLVPYWNVNLHQDFEREKLVEIRLVPYWNVNIVINGDYYEVEFIRLVPYWNVNSAIALAILSLLALD